MAVSLCGRRAESIVLLWAGGGDQVTARAEVAGVAAQPPPPASVRWSSGVEVCPVRRVVHVRVLRDVPRQVRRSRPDRRGQLVRCCASHGGSGGVCQRVKGADSVAERCVGEWLLTGPPRVDRAGWIDVVSSLVTVDRG